MEGKKIVVPDGMLWAVCKSDFGITSKESEALLELALRWQQPVLKKILEEVIYDCCHSLSQPSMQHYSWGMRKAYLLKRVLDEVQLRMFLAPEPEVPEEIRDLLFTQAHGIPETKDGFQNLNDLLLEAYRRGQRSK